MKHSMRADMHWSKLMSWFGCYKYLAIRLCVTIKQVQKTKKPIISRVLSGKNQFAFLHSTVKKLDDLSGEKKSEFVLFIDFNTPRGATRIIRENLTLGQKYKNMIIAILVHYNQKTVKLNEIPTSL